MNAMILPMLQIAARQSDDINWDQYLTKIEQDLNTSVNKTTGQSAFELVYGYIPRFKDGITRDLTVDTKSYTEPKYLRDEAINV